MKQNLFHAPVANSNSSKRVRFAANIVASNQKEGKHKNSRRKFVQKK